MEQCAMVCQVSTVTIPPIRSSAFERRLRLVLLILFLGEIMPLYSYYIEKRLFYIIIIAPLGRQPFFYIKCTKLNIRSSYNIRLVSNAKCTYLIYSYILRSLRLFYLIYLRVSRNGIRRET